MIDVFRQLVGLIFHTVLFQPVSAPADKPGAAEDGKNQAADFGLGDCMAAM